MHPQSPPVHNFFCGARARRIGRYRDGEDACARGECAPLRREIKNSDAAKTHILRAFLRHAGNFAKLRANEKVFRATLLRRARCAARAGAAGGAYTQN